MRLVRTYDAVLALELARYEELPVVEARAAVVPELDRLCRLVTTEVETVGAACGGDTVDLTAMALAEIDRARARLEDDLDLWPFLSASSRLQRRQAQALVVVDREGSLLYGSGPELPRATTLECSLQIRHCFSGFRQAVGTRAPEGDAVPSLRRIGTAIAVTVGADCYPRIRFDDRRELRALQARVLDWLRCPAEPQDALRIWQDAAGLAEMFSQINRRQEILEHDRHALALLEDRLGTGAPLSHEEVRALRSLSGASPELDALLSERETRLDRWAEALACVRARSAATVFG